MINDQIFANLESLRKNFQEAMPYRHVVIPGFLNVSVASQLAREFPPIQGMEVQYQGLNEKKAEHSTFDHLTPVFSELKKELASEKLVKLVEDVTGIKNLIPLGDRYGCGLHQGGRGSFLDIHVDYNLHPIERKQRRLNLIIFLNPEWNKEWGGELELWNKDVSQCIQAIPPLFNQAVIFECHDHSFHGYSSIQCPQEITRKSFYQYYFTEPSEKMLFHDTIFKNKPGASLPRRTLVSAKEFVKNSVKRVMYHLGLKQFFK